MMNLIQNKDSGNDGELNCLWMDANIDEYLLCEKDFDCESCVIDKILSNLSNAKDGKESNQLVLGNTDFIDNTIYDMERMNLESQMIYLKNDLVLKHLFAGIFYLGINPLTVRLLENVDQVKEQMKRIYFVKDQTIISFVGEWGNLTFKSPMNFLLLDKLNWTFDDIKTRQWIALVLVNQSEILETQLSGVEWQTEKLNTITLLKKYKYGCSKIIDSSKQAGKEIKFFSQLTGKDEYLKILRHFFNE